jgi:hypothetical protein
MNEMPNIHGWEYYELGQEMRGAGIAKLLAIYSRESQKYSDKCLEYVDLDNKLNAEAKERIKEHCEFLDGAKMLLALRIADMLTKE